MLLPLDFPEEQGRITGTEIVLEVMAKVGSVFPIFILTWLMIRAVVVVVEIEIVTTVASLAILVLIVLKRRSREEEVEPATGVGRKVISRETALPRLEVVAALTAVKMVISYVCSLLQSAPGPLQLLRFHKCFS